MMAKSRCFKFLSELPQEFLSDEDKQTFFSALANSPEGSHIADAIAEEMRRKRDAFISDALKRRYILHIKVADAMHHIRQYPDMARGLKSFLHGIYSNVRGAGRSCDATMKSYRARYYGMLATRLDEEGLMGHFQDKNNIVEIANQLVKPIDARPRPIKSIAAAIKDIFKVQLKDLNSRGMDVGELSDFIAHTHHDRGRLQQFSGSVLDRRKLRDSLFKQGLNRVEVQEKLNDLAFRRWHDFILPRLDIERTFGDMDPEESLRAAYRNIIKGKPLGADELVYRGPMSIVKRTNASRFFHFKDGQGWLEYSKEYGGLDFHQAVLRTLEDSANKIGLLDKMGPGYEAFYRTVQKRIIDESSDPKIRSKVLTADKYFNILTGRNNSAESELLARIGSSVRLVTGLTKLGAVVFRSIPDLAGELSVLRSNGVGLFDRYSIVTKQFFQYLNKKSEIRKLADVLGSIADTSLGHYMSRYSAIDTPTGLQAKIQQLYFRLNLIHGWDNTLRLGTATGLARNLALNKDKIFTSLSRDLQKSLKRYGIEEKEWDLYRSNKEGLKTVNGKLFITPDAVDSFTKEQLLKYANKNILSKLEEDAIRSELRTALQTYFIDQTDLAQIQTGVAERGMLLGNTRPGTYEGEILRFFAHFKNYVAGVSRRSVGRFITENTNENVFRSLGEANWGGLGDFFINAMLFGYLSSASTSLMRNGTLPNPEEPRTLLEMLSSPLGIYGELLTANAQSYGKNLTDAVIGPDFAKVNDLARVIYTALDFSNEGHRLNYHQRALRQLTGFLQHDLTPSLFYANPVFKHLIYNNILNEIDPTYIYNQKQKQQKNIQQHREIPIF